MSHYQEGNTIKLTATFKDFDENPVDPDLVRLIIYDSSMNQLDQYPIAQGNRIDTGSFYYNFVPRIDGIIFYEWYAEIDGLPSLKRKHLQIKKV